MRGVQSAAVIDHLEAEWAWVVGEVDHDRTRAGVVFDVVQRFLRDSEDDQLLFGVQPQPLDSSSWWSTSRAMGRLRVARRSVDSRAGPLA